MSLLLAQLLRDSRSVYGSRWTERARTGFATEPKADVIAQHLEYWDAIVVAVETNEFDHLLSLAREAGRAQARAGLEISDAVNRTVGATNMIEMAVLEVNGNAISPIDIIGEIADLRSMIVLAVVDGYKSATASSAAAPRGEQLRATLLREPARYPSIDLAAGHELGPLYDEDVRFYVVVSGKLRLYNLLSNGRAITLSILSADDVFFQWRVQSASLSVVNAEAMQATRLIGVSQPAFTKLISEQPAMALGVIENFSRRLTESQALIDDLMNSSVNMLLYRTLLELARQFGRQRAPGESGGVLINVPLTHQRLADMIGSNRVTVTRKLHELQQRGVIHSHGAGSIEVIDIEALNRLVATAAS